MKLAFKFSATPADRGVTMMQAHRFAFLSVLSAVAGLALSILYVFGI